MARTRFKIPSCAINPRTERPYVRHKWSIVPGVLNQKNSLYYYHIVCERPTCKLNSPNPIAY